MQVPGYIEKADELKKRGIDEVIVFCVNDGAVMQAWAENQQIQKAGGLIRFMADPTGEVTRSLDLRLNHPGPASVGIIGRGKRAAMYVIDGEVKVVRVAEGPDDPAGDAVPDVTLAPALLEAIDSITFKADL